ncbi:MAG: hypothetical protein VB062_04660 [Christensenella sp.]|nr:hypothetical protein [Christensenella sp.]
MQDECKVKSCGECKYTDVCPYQNGICPQNIDLTDPPRFSDEAMEFFKWWYDRGAKKAVNTNSYEHGAIIIFEDFNQRQLGNAQVFSIIEEIKHNGNEVDLAELPWKEGDKE